MANLQIHQKALDRLGSRTLKLAYTLENFSDIRKATVRAKDPTKGSRGKTFAGLSPIKDIDKEEIARQIAPRNWAGKKATSTLFRMADSVVDKFDLELSYREKWHLGRVLMSAFTYAGLYVLARDDDAYDSPYYVIEPGGVLPESTKVEKTSFERFPRWKSNIDKFGNRLVKPSYPCPIDKEYEPVIHPSDPWVKAVHALEDTAFKINKEVLKLAIETDKKVGTRVIPKKPSKELYDEPRKKLDEEYKKKGLVKIKKLREKDVELRRKDAKRNKPIRERNKNIAAKNRTRKKQGKKLFRYEEYKRSKGYHATKEQDKVWDDWNRRSDHLETLRQRVISRRQRFERELKWATEMAQVPAPFYHRVSVDYRGRVYLPDFSYQGSDFCRAVIEFEKAGVMTVTGKSHLMRHTANMVGSSQDHDTRIMEGFLEVERHKRIGCDPKQHWKEINNKGVDKPFGFLRVCLEWRDVLAHEVAAADRKDPAVKKDLKALGKNLAMLEDRYSKLDLVTIKTKKYKEKVGKKRNPYAQDLPPARNNKHLRTRLPLAADQTNSAFQHIGMMLKPYHFGRRNIGLDLFNQVMEEDVYQLVANDPALDFLPKEYGRKIVKMIVVPWSYGGTEYSCKKKVREWRRENAGTIEYLDNLDSQGLNDMVHDVFDVLRTRFRACIRYQNEVKGMVEAVKQKYKRAQDKKKPTAKHEFIQWTTSSNFMVHQRVHNAESKQDIVCNGFFGEAELKALVPTSEINWRKMKTKTPPNLVHSYDAALVHLVSTGKIGSTWQSGAIEGVEHGESQGLTFMDREEVEWECSPLVSVHDSFSTVASESEKLVTGLRRLFDYSYIVNLPFGRFCKEVTGKTFHRKPSGTHLRKPVVDDASPEKRPFA